MLKWFKCPDGKIVEVEQCLNYPYGSCRLEERCLTYPTLAVIAKEREWTGEPSTTQLINGTMLEFLKITQPYVVDPDDRAFSLHGTLHHEMLEDVAKSLNLPAELALSEDEDRDILDLLLPTGDGTYILTDYKTWGSYKVAKALGIVEIGKRPDPSGEVYKSSGKWGKAGSPKMVPVFERMASEADNFEAELQLNNYRIKAKDKYGIEISKMQVQATIRDGGLAVAKGRGLSRNFEMIKVARLDDEDVRSYFREKRQKLIMAVSGGKWDEPCNEVESWDGTRCERYCEVAMYCPKGILYRKES